MISQPLSGTLVGPWVGAFSDGLQTKWGRRRPVMVLGAVSATALLILLAWVDEWVHLLACPPNSCGEYEQTVQHFVQGAAVTLVVGLSIAVQPFQSGARSIIIDNLPAGQQNEANVSSSRIICIGGIAGFLAGTIDIPSVFNNSYQITQLQALAVLNAVVITSSVGITCLVFEESSQWCFRDGRGPRPLINIWRSVHGLPDVIRRVCLVQFFAWSAWYPLLYYTTTYIAELGKTTKRQT
jgi:solute carrier family 45 protein 1/2/4